MRFCFVHHFYLSFLPTDIAGSLEPERKWFHCPPRAPLPQPKQKKAISETMCTKSDPSYSKDHHGWPQH